MGDGAVDTDSGQTGAEWLISNGAAPDPVSGRAAPVVAVVQAADTRPRRDARCRGRPWRHSAAEGSVLKEN